MTEKNGLAGVRLLIVEDETMVAMLLEEMLLDLGCQVVGPARTVDMALATIESEKFDGAIVDVNLRGTRADPIAAALKDRGVPFVFATGYGQAGIDERFMDVPVIQKPFEITTLEAILAGVMAAAGGNL